MSNLNFKINWQKAIEGVQLLITLNPKITPYYIAKVFFYADKEHMVDWGRSICGDFYVAMEHGPVPSAIYNLISSDVFLDDDIIADFQKKIAVNGRALTLKEKFVPNTLSKTDIQYLENAERIYAHMPFGKLRELVHKERSWREAWEGCRSGKSAVMDMTAMIDDNLPQRDLLIAEIREKAFHAPH